MIARMVAEAPGKKTTVCGGNYLGNALVLPEEQRNDEINATPYSIRNY